MSVEAVTCPSCGTPLKSTDVMSCEYCGVTLAYSGPQQLFIAKGEEGTFRGIARNLQQRQEKVA